MRHLNIEATIGLYLDSLHDRGLQDSSVVTTARVLRSFFRPMLAEPLPNLDLERTLHLADALARRVGMSTRRPLAKVTRRNYRDQARAFLAWCVQQRRLAANPLDPVVTDREPEHVGVASPDTLSL